MSSIASGTTTTTGLIYTSDTTGNLVLQTNGTTTAVTIDTNQNVGIGTSSPSTYGTGITVYSTTGGLNLTDGTGKNGVTAQGNTLFLRADTAGTSGDMRFYVNGNTERARIDSSGNLLVGTTTAKGIASIYTSSTSPTNSEILDLNSASSTANVVVVYSRMGIAGSTSNYHFIGQANGADKVYIYGNGNIVNSNNSYGTLSDAKLKTNVVSAQSQWNDVKALGQTMKKFNLLSDPTGPLQLGWVAQDVQNISAGLVFTTPDKDEEGNLTGTTTLGVNTSVAQLKAFKALSEALVRIEALEAKVG